MEINECEEKFWNSDSFHYYLESEDIWDVDKYWDLETPTLAMLAD